MGGVADKGVLNRPIVSVYPRVVVSATPDAEEVSALLGHAQIDTTQVYTTIRPPQLKRAVAFYEDRAAEMVG